jgi:hypothetical protein
VWRLMGGLFVALAGVTAVAQQGTGAALRAGFSTDGMWLIREFDATTGQHYGTLPAATVQRLRQRLSPVADFALFCMATNALHLSDDRDNSRYLSTGEMTPGALTFVGVPPVLGREFTDADLGAGRRAAIVTYQVWQGIYGGRADILNTHLWQRTAQGPQPVAIVGVLARDFSRRVPVADPNAEAFIVARDWIDPLRAEQRVFPPLVRLRPDANAAQVQSALEEADRTAMRSDTLRLRLDPADRPGWMK